VKRSIADAAVLATWIGICVFLRWIAPPHQDWDNHVRCYYSVPGWHWEPTDGPQGYGLDDNRNCVRDGDPIPAVPIDPVPAVPMVATADPGGPTSCYPYCAPAVAGR
jgi:hypothetical protein